MKTLVKQNLEGIARELKDNDGQDHFMRPKDLDYSIRWLNNNKP